MDQEVGHSLSLVCKSPSPLPLHWKTSVTAINFYFRFKINRIVFPVIHCGMLVSLSRPQAFGLVFLPETAACHL